MVFTLVVFGACGVLAGSAAAQTIYRCGNEYTRVPCPNGKPIESLEPRTAAQRAEARQQLIDEKRQGAEMERDRLRKEAALKPALASSLSAAPAAHAASAPSKKPSQKKRQHKVQSAEADRDFIAAVPGSGKKSTKRP
jgi:hypothetical protein